MESVLHNKMREHRGRLNMSQDYLAMRIGKNRMTIVNYETGKTHPDVLMALRIAEVFGVTVEEVFQEVKL